MPCARTLGSWNCSVASVFPRERPSSVCTFVWQIHVIRLSKFRRGFNQPVRTTPVPATGWPPQRFLASQSFVEGHDVQLIHHPRAASAPFDADATAAGEDRGSPNPVPRSAEGGLRSGAATTIARPGDRSSVCVPAWCGSRRRSRSTARTAGSPSKRSNQRAYPLASMPTRTCRPCSLSLP
jgi:hypothetical protein